MKIKGYLCLLSIILFTSCFDAEKQRLIIGSWNGIEWLVEGRPSSHAADAVAFHFDETGKYTYRYQDFMESGKYNVANNQLFTTPEGGERMMVKIVKLDQDTLVFDMNRSGQSELLKLVRAQ
jgi:hypothetical protein